MNAKIEGQKRKKEDLKEKVLEKEVRVIGITLDLVLDQLEEKSCPETDEGWFCQDMFEIPGKMVGDRLPLVLEVLYEEDYLERKVNMGIPHYRIKK